VFTENQERVVDVFVQLEEVEGYSRRGGVEELGPAIKYPLKEREN
jgi:hypothetical protein